MTLNRRPKPLRLVCPGCGRFDFSDLYHCGGAREDVPVPPDGGCHRTFNDEDALVAHLDINDGGEGGCRNPAESDEFYAVAGMAGHGDTTVWHHGPRPDQWPLRRGERVHPTPDVLAHR